MYYGAFTNLQFLYNPMFAFFFMIGFRLLFSLIFISLR
jgi:hypothetical protein